MSKPLLRKMTPDDFVQQYGIHGFDYLIVQGTYNEDSSHAARLTGWMVIDTRFHQGFDKWARWLVISFDTLTEVREWIRSGGPEFWNPEHRKTDRNWRPLPDGCSHEEARSEVPRRADSGVRDAGGVGRRSRRGREVRPGGGGPDLRRDHEDREPAPLDFGLTPKKYAVAPGYVTSANDGQRHWIGFGALTWLYGVNPSDCIRMSGEERGWDKEGYRHLIWLYPQNRYEDYESMKAELARGEDAFKLTEPNA